MIVLVAQKDRTLQLRLLPTAHCAVLASIPSPAMVNIYATAPLRVSSAQAPARASPCALKVNWDGTCLEELTPMTKTWCGSFLLLGQRP